MPNVMSRIVGPANLASGTSTVFTGTTAHTYSLREIRILNNGATAITVKLGVGGVTDALLVLPATAIQPGQLLRESGLVVLSGTETLQANTSASGLTITVSALDQS